MAETIGIIASSVAFVEVATKIGSQVLTLKQLWEDIKDAPHTIRSLIDDIDLLNLLLQEMEADFSTLHSDAIAWNDGVSTHIMKCCRKALDDLTASANELSLELNSTKRLKRGAVKGKLALKRDFWAKYEKRLQRVCWMLGLTQQYWLL
jgi:hypothetical protein